MTPPVSGPNTGVSSTAGMLVSTGRVRRVAVRRRGVAERPEEAPPDEVRRVAARLVRVVDARGVAVRRVVDARLVAFLRAVPAAVLVRLAVRRAVVAARRRVEAARDPVPRAIWRACLVRPSI